MLAQDEVDQETARICLMITGPRGLLWRVVSSKDSRAYAAWRFARFFGGKDDAWPTLAVKLLFPEPKEIRDFIFALAKLLAKHFYGVSDANGESWVVDSLLEENDGLSQ